MVTHTVQSVDRSFLILNKLAEHHYMSLNDISKETALHKATAHRLVNTLLSNGFVQQDQHSKLYSLTFKLFELGQAKINHLPDIHLAKRTIQKLAVKMNHTVHLVAEDKQTILYLDRYHMAEGIKSISSTSGTRAPMYCTAEGRALLAKKTDSEIKEYWNNTEIKKLTRYTLTDFSKLMNEIEKIRQRHYAIELEEFQEGFFSISTILSNEVKLNNGAISIALPIEELPNKEYYVKEILDSMHDFLSR